jgi:hypothetical protein
MAKTKTSKSGVQRKKIAPVKKYIKKDGTEDDSPTQFPLLLT